jgi:acyl-coenzyme A thioesterase PaaI-like protein
MRAELDKHLSGLKRSGGVKSFSGGSIAVGAEQAATLAAHAETARVFLVLVSASFLASSFFDGPVMARAMERHRTGEALVIPIYIRPCDWADTWLHKLTVLPRDTKSVPEGDFWKEVPIPVSKLDRDDAFSKIADELRRLVAKMRGR